MQPTPFDGKIPLKKVYPLAGTDTQAAIDAATPGTAIFPQGKSTKPYKFSKSGTVDFPIWLVDAQIEQPAGVTSGPSGISAWNLSNIVILRPVINGGYRGIYLGSDATVGSTSIVNNANNLCVLNGRINNVTEDGIKVSHVTGSWIMGNTISNTGFEGIDHVNVYKFNISYNEIYNVRSTAAGVFYKQGCLDGLVEYNYIHDCTADGMSAGGKGTSNTNEIQSYSCKNVIIQFNKIERVGQNPLVTHGAVDSVIRNNYLSCAPAYAQNLNFTTGYHDQWKSSTDHTIVRVTFYTKNVEAYGNWLVGNSKYSCVSPNTCNFHDNKLLPTEVWSIPVGPSATPAWDFGTPTPPEPEPTPTPTEDVAALKARITELEAQVRSLQLQLAAAEQQKQSDAAAMAQLQSMVNGLTTQRDTLQAKIDKAKADLE